MGNRIVCRQILSGYRLRLSFNDGAMRTLDFEKILTGPVFGPLRDLRKFRKVTVNREFGCLEWPNGADLCPDALYHGYLPDLNAGAMDAMECEEYESHVEDEAMTKSKCRTTYRVKVKSKTSGRWRWALVGCNRKNMERAVRLYKEKFGETAKIVVKA